MKKIIFDLDSTLLTISEEWINYYQKFIDKYKFNISPKELYSGIGDFEKDSKGIIVKPEYFCNYLNNKLSIQMT